MSFKQPLFAVQCSGGGGNGPFPQGGPLVIGGRGGQVNPATGRTNANRGGLGGRR